MRKMLISEQHPDTEYQCVIILSVDCAPEDNEFCGTEGYTKDLCHDKSVANFPAYCRHFCGLCSEDEVSVVARTAGNLMLKDK